MNMRCITVSEALNYHVKFDDVDFNSLRGIACKGHTHRHTDTHTDSGPRLSLNFFKVVRDFENKKEVPSPLSYSASVYSPARRTASVNEFFFQRGDNADCKTFTHSWTCREVNGRGRITVAHCVTKTGNTFVTFCACQSPSFWKNCMGEKEEKKELRDTKAGRWRNISFAPSYSSVVDLPHQGQSTKRDGGG